MRPQWGSGRLSHAQRQLSVGAVVSFGAYGLGIVTGPLLAQALGDEGRGNLAAVVVPNQLLGWLLCFGLPSATVFFAARHPLKDILGLVWTTTVLLGAVVLAAVWTYVPDYMSGQPPSSTAWFRAYLVYAALFAPAIVMTEVLRVQERILAYSLVRTLPVTLNFVAVVGLAISGRLTLQTALAANLITGLAALVVMLVVTRQLPRPGLGRGLRRPFLAFAFRVAGGLVASQVVARLDQVMLVSIVAPAELGHYAVAVTYAGLGQALALGVASSVFPMLLSRDNAAAERLFSRAVTAQAAISTALALVLAAAAPTVLPLLYGDDFTPAVRLAFLLLPGAVLGDVAIVLAGRFAAGGRPGLPSVGLGLSAVLTVAGLSVFPQRYGTTGAALVTVGAQAFFFVFILVARLRVQVDLGRPAEPPDAVVT